MAGNQLPYFAREALRTMLTNDLPALLDTIDTAVGDGIVSHDLTHIYTAPMVKYDTLPVALIMTLNTQYPDLERSDDIRAHMINIQLWDQSIEKVGTMLPAEVVAERVERMATAVNNLIEANCTLLVSGTHNSDYCSVEEIQYSDFQPRGAVMVRGALVQLMARYSL